MPSFGTRSRQRLEGVDGRLVEVLEMVVDYYDITILEGVRTEERQRELFAAGKSKTMKSKHLVGEAVDIAPYPLPDWLDTNEWIYMGGHVMMAAYELGIMQLRWGGDWNRNQRLKDNTFNDYVHFEIDE